MASDSTQTQPAGLVAAPVADEALYGRSYFASHHRPFRDRPALSQDLDVDVCVIGAGLAGLTAALEIARRGWSVIVLEAGRVAWNASGRNTGIVLPGFAQNAQTIVERVGLDAARELWMLSQSGVDYVRETASDPAMSAREPSEGWLHVSRTDRTKALRDETELLRNLGGDVEFWPESLVRSKLRSDGYFQAVHVPTAFSIHALNYALGLAELAEQAGVRIFENSAATAIDPAGVRKRVTTAANRVRAAHVVLAGNTHSGSLTPHLSRTLVPIQTYVIVTGPLGPELAEAIDYPGSVSDTERADSHYRIVGGDRLMWSGRMTTWRAQPYRFGRKLRSDMIRRFPQLKARVDYAWTGELGMTVHGMPQIGQVSPGVWLASGFAGHGINTSAMAAQLIAGAVVEGDDRWRLFQPFELVWAGGRTGRLIVQGADWMRRNWQAFASRRSRAGEERRIRMAPILKQRAERAEERARLYAEREEREALARAERLQQARDHQDATLARKARMAEIRAEKRAERRERRAWLAIQRAEAERLEAERIVAEKIAAEAARLAAEGVAQDEAAALPATQDPRFEEQPRG